MQSERKVGLVLGSGSARGWSHIGVIEALLEESIPINLIAGTSIGAYIGAVYAGNGLSSLKEFALKMDWKKVMSYIDVVFPRSGFLNGKKIADLITMHTTARTFMDLSVPVKMVATDMNTGDRVIIDSGSITEAVRASCSVPGILTPVKAGGRWLVDGGLVDPIPVGLARSMGAAMVIAVDLNTGLTSRYQNRIKPPVPKPIPRAVQKERKEIIARLADQYEQAGKIVKYRINQWFKSSSSSPHIIDVMGASNRIMQERIAKINIAIEPPDILIRPLLGDLKMFDFDQAERSIREGYRRTMEKMKDIKRIFNDE